MQLQSVVRRHFSYLKYGQNIFITFRLVHTQEFINIVYYRQILSLL